jgi:DNA-binding response OmpR family regulator
VAPPPSGPPADRAGPLRLDVQTFSVWRGTQPLPRPLAAREFALVRYLYDHADRVCTRQELGDAVWGRDRWDPDMLYRLVRRVKEKLEPQPAHPRYLLTVPGFGYRLAPATAPA